MKVPRSRRAPFCGATLFIVAILLVVVSTAYASSVRYNNLYGFHGSPDASYPSGGLIADASGNLYGTTQSGGLNATCFCGTVFQFAPPATPGGTWTETVLHSFGVSACDGEGLQATLLLDKLGNLYGTTTGGSCGAGTVFELSPPAVAGQSWTETILYSFTGTRLHGGEPGPTLAMDASGNLYGTTPVGGIGNSCVYITLDCGVVFELHAPKTNGAAWTEQAVYSFGMPGDSLYGPSHLVMRGTSFYGTARTIGGGGAVFQLARSHGIFTRTVLYEFPSDGFQLLDVLTFDSAGNIFGNANAVSSVCPAGCGGVFELSPPGTLGDPWTETTLYSFTGRQDGYSPTGRLVLDKSGNLYGATELGVSNAGAVFELSPPATPGDPWAETTLHEFGSVQDQSGNPWSGLLFLKGRFYGTTWARNGTIFSLTIVP
jgi:uncharacterized repeat protein (TIGR03803 family)